jgi:hypothetical protein
VIIPREVNLGELLGQPGLDEELRAISALAWPDGDARVRTLRDDAAARTIIENSVAEAPGLPPIGGFTWELRDDEPDSLRWTAVSIAEGLRGQGWFGHFTFAVAYFIRDRLGRSEVLVTKGQVTPQIRAIVLRIGFEDDGTYLRGRLDDDSPHMEYVRWKRGEGPRPSWRDG